MQTFLPYPNFQDSAKCLDRMRLGKQRVESLQIIKALNDPDYGWQNHPAVKMWRNHVGSLIMYSLVICDEWIARGYVDNCKLQIMDFFHEFGEEPPWLGDPDFHKSHRSNLLRKDYTYYKDIFEPGLRDDLPYIWPL